jgi:hypothetical protein
MGSRIRAPFSPKQPAIPGAVINCACEQAHEEHPMMDILMLALAFLFFAAAIGYTYACERL